MRQIQAAFPVVPVIIFTGKAPEVGEARKREAYGYILKPVDYGEVVTLLHQTVQVWELQQRLEKEDELVGATRTLAELTLSAPKEALLQTVAEIGQSLLNVPVCIVWELDRIDRQLKVAAWAGEAGGVDEDYRDSVQIDSLSDATQVFLARREALALEEVQHAPFYNPNHKKEAQKRNWISLLTAPMIAQDQVIGILDAYTHTRRLFASWEKDLMTAFAGQVAVAMQNAERLQAIQRLNEIGRSLSTLPDSSQVLEQMLSQIANAAREVLGADTVDLYQYYADQDRFVLPPIRVGTRLSASIKPERLYPDDVVAHIADSGEPIYASDAQTYPALAGKRKYDQEDIPDTRFVFREKIKSAAGIPLQVGEESKKEVVGVLFVSYRHQRDFESEAGLKERIEILANQAAVGINNARLLRREQQRGDALDLVQGISAEINAAPGVEQVLKSIVKGAVRLVGVESGVIHLFDEARQSVIDSYEFPEGFEHPMPRISQKKGMTWGVLEKGQVIAVPDITKDARVSSVMVDKGVRAIIGVPLKLRGEVIGVLYLNHLETHEFTEDETELLTTLADHAAIAIEKTRLIEEQEKRAEHLVQLQRVTTAISAEQSSLKDVAQLIVDGLAEVFPGDACTIRLYNAEADEFESLVATAGIPEESVMLQPRSAGTSRYLLQTGKSRYLEGDQMVNPPDDGPPVREDIRVRDVKATAYLPLVSNQQVVGILYVNRMDIDRFPASDRRILELFADQAAIAVENARLFESSQGRIRDLEIVNEVAQILSTKLSVQDILDTIVSQVAERVGCAMCTAFFLGQKEGSRVLEPRATAGKRSEPVWGRSFKLDEKSLAGWVFLHGESVVLPDVRDDERFAGARREVQGLHRSMLVVPIQVGGETNGVISADQDELSWFDEGDKRLVEALGRQAAIAIRSVEQRVSDLETLSDINKAIVRGDWSDPDILDKILQLIADEILELLKPAACAIRLYDPVSKKLGRRTASGELKEAINFEPRSEGASQRILGDGKPIYADNPSIELCAGQPVIRQKVREKGVQAAAYLPLLSEGEVIGILYLDWTEPRRFPIEERQVLELFAGQAALAIRSAQRLRDLDERATQLEKLQEVTQTISAWVVDLDKVLRLIMTEINDIYKDASCEIRLYDPQRQAFTMRIAAGLLEAKVDYSPREDGTSRYLIKHKQRALYADNPESVLDNKNKQLAIREEVFEKGVQAIAFLPLWREREPIGMLYVNWEEPRQFSENDRRVLELFASEAAIAIQNARQYAQLNAQYARVNAVTQVGEILTSSIELSEQEILNTVYEQASEVMDTDNMYIALYNAETDVVRFGLMYVDGKSKRVEPRTGGAGRTEWIIHQREPLLIETREESMAWYAQRGRKEYIKEPFASWLGVPMMVAGKVLGVIATYHKTQDYVYDQDDQQILSLMASQAAIALENARLYAEAQKKAQEMDTLRGLAEDLSAGALL
jgi:GAF domain-containing protein